MQKHKLHKNLAAGWFKEDGMPLFETEPSSCQNSYATWAQPSAPSQGQFLCGKSEEKKTPLEHYFWLNWTKFIRS